MKKLLILFLLLPTVVFAETTFVDFSMEKGTNIFGVEVFKESNYSNRNVRIPDGTKVHDINFSQQNPHTSSISGKYLTFIDCNLTNVEIHESWKLINCLSVQSKRYTVQEGDIIYEIFEVEKKGEFVEISRIDITPVDDLAE